MAVEKTTKERTKVVLRHIPPGFTSESLLELLIKTVVPFPKYDFYHFAPADYSLAPYLSCRAYFNFLTPESAFLFKDRFDGQKFIDCNKVQSVGIVEYAPFQRIPKRFKKDVRSGTIDKDPEYLEFLKELKIEPEAPPSIETIIDEIEKQRATRAEQQSSTALLEYIKTRRAERSLSPHSKPQYPRKERPAKVEDREIHRNKGGRSRGRSNSEEEGYDNRERPRAEEFRSRNNVKHDRLPKSATKGKPEKAIYVPGKKKSDEPAKYILSSSSRDKSDVSKTSKDDETDKKCNEERQSYRRDRYDSDKKDTNSEAVHNSSEYDKRDRREGSSSDRRGRRDDHHDSDRNANGREYRRDDNKDYRRDGYESRNKREKEYRRDGYNDDRDRRDRDYDRDDYYDRKGRGSYRGGYNRSWRDDRRGRGGRGRGRGSSRGHSGDR